MVLVLMDPKGDFLLITSVLRLPIYSYSLCSPINYRSFCVQVLNIHTITADFYHVVFLINSCPALPQFLGIFECETMPTVYNVGVGLMTSLL